jgi:hypothetical protein
VKKIIFLAVLATLCAGTFLYAQQFTSESDYYYFSFPIEKIYVYRMGYMVVYRGNSNKMSRTFVPHEWFNTMGAKGEIVYLGAGREWPSMTVYYNSGEFSHIRLKLRRDRSHETWGVIPLSVNLDDYFQNVEEIDLEY